MNYKLLCSIRVNCESLLQTRFVFPFLLSRIIIKIMNRTISVCVFVIISASNLCFYQCLMIVQCKSISISQICGTVVTVIHMRKCHRLKAAFCVHRVMNHDQISMNCPGSSRILTVISPVIFQTRIVHIRNINSRSHILVSIVTIG